MIHLDDQNAEITAEAGAGYKTNVGQYLIDNVTLEIGGSS